MKTSSHKILVVDDEQRICDTLALIFSRHGYQVRVSYSAKGAIEILAEWQPDLAILDVVLPSMNGIDLAVFLAVRYPTCKTLLFSGNPFTTDLLAQAAQKGYAFSILTKPVHPELMLETALAMLTADRKQIQEAAGATEHSMRVDFPPEC